VFEGLHGTAGIDLYTVYPLYTAKPAIPSGLEAICLRAKAVNVNQIQPLQATVSILGSVLGYLEHATNVVQHARSAMDNQYVRHVLQQNERAHTLQIQRSVGFR
jgi:hypothetical protein